LWTYDVSAREFIESPVSSIYRDRLAEVSGKTGKDIIEELRLRTKLIRIMAEKDIKGFTEVTKFCCQYAANPSAAIETLGLKREDLLRE
jgi:hypothetical protein